ncbi:hypothetical protein ESCO_004652 [Escovopsis weberi]|uniref:Nudix hydrolase domain-containing protein n=1 Tax=Escovopsis weberi TaxID=150374 RepID=A0A0M9VRM9_ESCWE|nr:hypothetical protein ESCO_004652 [Escovopsis weberi]
MTASEHPEPEPGPPQDFTHAPGLALLAQHPSVLRSAHPHVAHLMTGSLVFEAEASPETSPEAEAGPGYREPRILLLRRAPEDSYPLSWELPGGSVDATDRSVLHAAARELWEETGLAARHFRACVGLLPAAAAAGVPSPEAAAWGIPPGRDADPWEEDWRAFQEADADADADADTDTRTDTRTDAGAGTDIKMLAFAETGELWAKVTLAVDVRDTGAVRVRPEEHTEFAWVTRREALTGWLDGEDGERRVLGFLSPAVRSQVLQAFRSRGGRSSSAYE